MIYFNTDFLKVVTQCHEGKKKKKKGRNPFIREYLPVTTLLSIDMLGKNWSPVHRILMNLFLYMPGKKFIQFSLM